MEKFQDGWGAEFGDLDLKRSPETCLKPAFMQPESEYARSGGQTSAQAAGLAVCPYASFNFAMSNFFILRKAWVTWATFLESLS